MRFEITLLTSTLWPSLVTGCGEAGPGGPGGDDGTADEMLEFAE